MTYRRCTCKSIICSRTWPLWPETSQSGSFCGVVLLFLASVYSNVVVFACLGQLMEKRSQFSTTSSASPRSHQHRPPQVRVRMEKKRSYFSHEAFLPLNFFLILRGRDSRFLCVCLSTYMCMKVVRRM